MSACNLSSPTVKTRHTARIVIIGSGPAGIAAGTRLLEQGFKDVRILEAENRIGGRINTIPFADNVVDLGAQWCHGETGNVVYERVKDLNIVEKTGDIDNTVRFIRSNKEQLTDELVKILRPIADNALPDDSVEYEGSLGDYVTHKFWREVDKLPNVDRKIASELFEQFKKYECSYEGSDNLFRPLEERSREREKERARE